MSVEFLFIGLLWSRIIEISRCNYKILHLFFTYTIHIILIYTVGNEILARNININTKWD